MLSCKDASQLVSDRLERKLSFRERWGLKMHLWICASCRHYEQQMVLIRQALRMLGKRAESEADSTEFPPEARERIRKALAARCEHDEKH